MAKRKSGSYIFPVLTRTLTVKLDRYVESYHKLLAQTYTPVAEKQLKAEDALVERFQHDELELFRYLSNLQKSARAMRQYKRAKYNAKRVSWKNPLCGVNTK